MYYIKQVPVFCRKLTRSIKLDSDVDLAVIACRTEGFSAADLKALLYTAQLGEVQYLQDYHQTRVDTKVDFLNSRNTKLIMKLIFIFAKFRKEIWQRNVAKFCKQKFDKVDK
jgi:ATP-dependent 26S proteasome regulatory subunit